LAAATNGNRCFVIVGATISCAVAAAERQSVSPLNTMHGVPPNLDLERFSGSILTQICLGEFQQQFHFAEPTLSISVEGGWQLSNAASELVDRSLENDVRDAYRVHRLLGRSVVGNVVNAPQSFTLRFDNGWSLTVFDDSRDYESFSIQPGDIFV
jgi:hypothetical protein